MVIGQNLRTGTPIVMYLRQDGRIAVAGTTGPCAAAVAAGLTAIGAAVLGLIALFTAGSGIVVAGIFVSSRALTAASLVTGGYAGYLAVASQYVC